MKKYLLLTFAAFATLTASAGTYTTNCSGYPIQFNGSVGSGTVSCAAYSGSTTLTGVTVNLVADYTFGSTASNDIKLTFGLVAPAGVTWATSSMAIDVTGGFNSSSTTPPIPQTVAATGGITNANFASAFNVNVASSIVSGGAGTSSAGVSVTYTYLDPVSNTPEPATLSLIGISLLGLGVAARRRRA